MGDPGACTGPENTCAHVLLQAAANCTAFGATDGAVVPALTTALAAVKALYDDATLTATPETVALVLASMQGLARALFGPESVEVTQLAVGAALFLCSRSH